MEFTDAQRRAVTSAIAFFDVFDHPLTLLEAWRLRSGWPQARVGDVARALRGSGIQERDGFYSLPGRSGLADKRLRRYRDSERKFRRASAAARLLRLLPSVRLVALCNSLALTGADKGSDIDLFIVTVPGAIWSTRLIAVGLLHLLGLRPTAESKQDTFCMSFFVAEDRVDLSSFAIIGKDPYLRYWLMTLVPLYDAGGMLDAVFAANAALLSDLPGAVPFAPTRGEIRGPCLATGRFLPLLRAAESFAKRFQLARLPAETRDLMNRDSRVVVNDSMLKFHVNDRRELFAAFAAERLARFESAYALHAETTR